MLLILSAVGRVALDTRLGCVSREGNDESKRIIDAINTFFWTVAEVELRLPVWRFYRTKAYRAYIAALDSFRELCMRHIDNAIRDMDCNAPATKNEEDISIIERIVRRTGNPKIAAVLALDLFLVGVDTVLILYFNCKVRQYILCSLRRHPWPSPPPSISSPETQTSKPNSIANCDPSCRTRTPSSTLPFSSECRICGPASRKRCACIRS